MADDLDSLLEDALCDLDAEEAAHKKTRDRQVAQLMQEQARAAGTAPAGAQQPRAGAATDSHGGAEGGESEMRLLASLQTLLGQLGAMPPDQDLSDDQVSAMQRTLQDAMSNLRTDATDQERAELDKCDDMLQRLQSSNPTAPTAEELKKLAENFETLAQQQQQEAALRNEHSSPPAATAANAEGFKNEVPPPAPDGAAEAEAEMAKALKEILNPAGLAASFTEIRGRYPAWLTANAGHLSAADRLRYETQYQLICELCDFLEARPELSVTDSESSDRFVRLVERLQELGPPPESLTQPPAP